MSKEPMSADEFLEYLDRLSADEEGYAALAQDPEWQEIHEAMREQRSRPRPGDIVKAGESIGRVKDPSKCSMANTVCVMPMTSEARRLLEDHWSGNCICGDSND